MDSSKEKEIRTFIGTPLPEKIKEQVRSVVGELKQIGAKVVWTRLENLHLTLKFLGDTSLEQLDKVKRSLQEAAEPMTSFRVSLKGLGGFPNEKKPRILWMAVEEGEAELKKLFYTLEREVVLLGIKEEKNEFVPHLTLGRIKFPKTNPELEEKIVQEKERLFGSWNISQFSLYQSTLTSEGPVYQVLHEFGFK